MLTHRRPHYAPVGQHFIPKGATRVHDFSLSINTCNGGTDCKWKQGVVGHHTDPAVPPSCPRPLVWIATGSLMEQR